MLPIFTEFDTINYLRYGSLYLEQIRRLPQDYPEIHNKFMNGLFVLKQKTECFNSVVGGLKLEQTISRSQKSASRILDQIRQREYVTKWQIVYHEIPSMSNKFRSLTDSNLSSRETELHHELDQHFYM